MIVLAIVIVSGRNCFQAIFWVLCTLTRRKWRGYFGYPLSPATQPAIYLFCLVSSIASGRRFRARPQEDTHIDRILLNPGSQNYHTVQMSSWKIYHQNDEFPGRT